MNLRQSMYVVHKIGKVIECKTYSINPAFTNTKVDMCIAVNLLGKAWDTRAHAIPLILMCIAVNFRDAGTDNTLIAY